MVDVGEHTETGRDSESARDLSVRRLPDLPWGEPEQRLSCLERVSAHVNAIGRDAVEWYRKEKPRKKAWAKTLRGLMLLLGAVAGVQPILAQVFGAEYPLAFAPAWASVALAAAAALVAFDRFFGFSKAWMRYMTTELAIRRHLHDFDLAWTEARARLQGSPTISQTLAMIGRAKTTVRRMDALVDEETNAWIEDFQANLDKIDEQMKAARAADRLGGFIVTVTNGDKCEGQWNLRTEGGEELPHLGRTAALKDLTPGLHKVVATGKIDSREVAAEALCRIPPGDIAEVEVTLA